MRLDAAPQDANLRAQFEAWLAENDKRRAAYAVVEPVWRLSTDLEPPAEPASVASLAQARRAKRPWRRAAIAGLGAIAAGLALIFLPAIQLHLRADHLTGVAEQRDVTLEDGSKVALDAGSAIAVHYVASRREVELLSGQAFFEVTPNRERPFVVTAAGVAVTVTGTAFSVGRSESGVTVAVQSGSVDVTVGAGAAVATGLVRGDRLQISGEGKVAKGQVAADDVASWRDRQLVVYDVPVREVVEQLGRYRHGAIVFRDGAIADRLVTGMIDLRRPAEALQALVDLQQGSMIEITPYLSIISSR
jgi:transmembrane sensor